MGSENGVSWQLFSGERPEPQAETLFFLVLGPLSCPGKGMLPQCYSSKQALVFELRA